MAEINIKIGRKSDSIDKTKAAKGQKPKQEAGAEAQSGDHYVENVTCCDCHAWNTIETSTTHTMVFQCWNCGAFCEY